MNIGEAFCTAKLLYLSATSPRSLFARARLEKSPRPALWPATNPPIGKKILKRRFDFAGCSIEMPGRITWLAPEANVEWHCELFSFSWLREIASSKLNKEASSFAREFINSFILDTAEQPDIAWDPNVAGERLAEWMYHLEFILKGSSKAFRKRLARSIIRHVLYLRKCVRQRENHDMIAAVWGIHAATSRFRDMRCFIHDAGQHLHDMIKHMILEDGMHISASPARQLQTLQILIDIRNTLPNDHPLYADIAKHAYRMGTMLHFCCHGDGRLALFNGSIMQDPALIARALELAGGSTAMPMVSSNGLCRLQRKQTCAFLLANAPAYSRQVFYGPLSMELSEGNERIVVNCGAYFGTDELWMNAVKNPAAHSTLSIDRSAADGDGKHEAEAPDIEAHEETMDPSIVAKLTPYKGVTHQRELVMAKHGEQLSGKDIITCTEEAAHSHATLRFHLHPDIRCQKETNHSVQLTSVSGKVWLFENLSGTLSIEESVYLGHNGKPQKTLQIVVTPNLVAGECKTEWTFKKRVK